MCSLTDLDLSSFNTSNVTDMSYMFSDCRRLTNLDLSSFDTSSVTTMGSMFNYCWALQVLKTPKSNAISAELPYIMYDESGNTYEQLPVLSKSIILTKEKSEIKIDLSNCSIKLSATNYIYDGKVKKPNVTVKDGSSALSSGTDYTVSYFNNTNAGTATVKVTGTGNYTGEKPVTFTINKADAKLTFASESISKRTLDEAFANELTSKTDGTVTFASSDTKVAEVNPSTGLVTIKGAGTATITVTAAEGKNYKAGSTSYKLEVTAVSIKNSSVGGVSLSYGYSGKAYTPTVTVKVDGKTLTKGTDYTVKYENNVKPGTAKITVTGKGKYTGTKTKTFEIVDCVSSVVSGKTYLLIPKNNAKTAVCAVGGKMVNNTKVYITDRGNSESQKFKAVKNSDGTWKFINAKCELTLAVQQNSSALGAGLVLYDQTEKSGQFLCNHQFRDRLFHCDV